jgi:hypothetical protein
MLPQGRVGPEAGWAVLHGRAAVPGILQMRNSVNCEGV